MSRFLMRYNPVVPKKILCRADLNIYAALTGKTLVGGASHTPAPTQMIQRPPTSMKIASNNTEISAWVRQISTQARRKFVEARVRVAG